MKSNEELTIRLDLESATAVHGESVFFTVVLSHSFDSPLSVTSFTPANRSLVMTMSGPGRRVYAADQISHSERDGNPVNTPRAPEGRSLDPGETMELRGDLLEWFGPVPPGDYHLRITYSGIMRSIESEPAALRILPVAIEESTVSGCPRFGDTPLAAAWTHRDKDGYLVMYEQLGPHLPRNRLHCVEAARTRERIIPWAACPERPGITTGHVWWGDEKNTLAVASVDLSRPGSHTLHTVVPPTHGAVPAGSALSLSDGSMLIPMFDPEQEELSILKSTDAGNTVISSSRLEGFSPNRPHAVFWKQNMLHLGWVDKNGTTIRSASMSFDTPSLKSERRTSCEVPETVMWITVYEDRMQSAQDLRALYLGEGKPPQEHGPRLMMWTVSAQPSGFVCNNISLADGTKKAEVLMKAKKPGGIRVVHAAVTSENSLSVLFADTSDNLFYGGTGHGVVVPLKTRVKKKITLRDHPCLVVGSSYPWVHLRYVPGGKSIEYIRIEPADEPDPVEKAREGE
ncbi:MAG: hypothetical protein ACP5G0_03565 [Desulfomonilia bacterium]